MRAPDACPRCRADNSVRTPLDSDEIVWNEEPADDAVQAGGGLLAGLIFPHDIAVRRAAEEAAADELIDDPLALGGLQPQ